MRWELTAKLAQGWKMIELNSKLGLIIAIDPSQHLYLGFIVISVN